MFINELEGCFGKLGDSEKQWVNENLEKLDESVKMNIMHELREHRGTISIPVMQKVLEKVTGKKARDYFWAVCLECGCEYDYRLPMCPACFDKGLDCRAKAVKKSEFKPTFKVIKYNKQYMNGDKNEQTCFTCIHKKESYCSNFGNPNWNCHREEFESCECKMCCGIAKKANRQLQESNAEHKISYAVPFKKVAV